MKLACEHLMDSNNDAAILSKGWASQYRELTSGQKILARKIISDVLFHGCLGHLTENTTQNIQAVLQTPEKTSTPIWSDSNTSSSFQPQAQRILVLEDQGSNNELLNENITEIQYGSVQEMIHSFEYNT